MLLSAGDCQHTYFACHCHHNIIITSSIIIITIMFYGLQGTADILISAGVVCAVHPDGPVSHPHLPPARAHHWHREEASSALPLQPPGTVPLLVLSLHVLRPSLPL